MNDFFRKSFGGISKEYYIRNFIFSLIFSACFIWVQSRIGLKPWLMFYCIINPILYPYARFAYENTMQYIIGKNVFAFNAGIFLIAKVITMAICWSFAIFMAPLGLIYLYHHHSKLESDK